MAVDQAGNNDQTARIELPVCLFRWFVPGSNDFGDFAAVDDNSVCRIGFRARPDGKGIPDPGSQRFRFIMFNLRTVYLIIEDKILCGTIK